MPKKDISLLDRDSIKKECLKQFQDKFKDIKDEQTLETKVTLLSEKVQQLDKVAQENLHKDLFLETLDEFKKTRVQEIRRAELTSALKAVEDHYATTKTETKSQQPRKPQKSQKPPKNDIPIPTQQTKTLSLAELALERFKDNFEKFHGQYTDIRPATSNVRKRSTKEEMEQPIKDFIQINREDINMISKYKDTKKELRKYINNLPPLVKLFIRTTPLFLRSIFPQDIIQDDKDRQLLSKKRL